MKNKEYIICSAIYINNGELYINQPYNINSGFVIAGRRHSDCIQTYANLFYAINGMNEDYPYQSFNSFKKQNSIYDDRHWIEGFITANNKFLNRCDAVVIAYQAGQINKLKKRLYSEDLY